MHPTSSDRIAGQHGIDAERASLFFRHADCVIRHSLVILSCVAILSSFPEAAFPEAAFLQSRSCSSACRNSSNSRSKPPERMGNRHQVLGSRFSSSKWNDGAYRSRFH